LARKVEREPLRSGLNTSSTREQTGTTLDPTRDVSASIDLGRWRLCSDLPCWVEPRGLEPLTPTLPELSQFCHSMPRRAGVSPNQAIPITMNSTSCHQISFADAHSILRCEHVGERDQCGAGTVDGQVSPYGRVHGLIRGSRNSCRSALGPACLPPRTPQPPPGVVISIAIVSMVVSPTENVALAGLVR
jgi:hypothetical protein